LIDFGDRPSGNLQRGKMSKYNGVHIYLDPAIFGGRPIIEGHRVTVHDVVVWHKRGEPVEEIARGFGLTSKEVNAAIAYFHDHETEIKRQIAQDEQEIARLAAVDSSSSAKHIRQVGESRNNF
jgi:uncharacterized protein (DUF433 family)